MSDSIEMAAKRALAPEKSAAKRIKAFGQEAILTAQELAAYFGWKQRYFDDRVRDGTLQAIGRGGNRRFHLGTVLQGCRAKGAKDGR